MRPLKREDYSTVGIKVFEYALLDKLIEKGLNTCGEQSLLQVGFSEGLSPGLAF